MSEVAATEPASALDAEELELLRLLADGLVLDSIARRMSMSERTLRRRIRALCDRFEVDAPVQIVVWAARRGLL